MNIKKYGIRRIKQYMLICYCIYDLFHQLQKMCKKTSSIVRKYTQQRTKLGYFQTIITIQLYKIEHDFLA